VVVDEADTIDDGRGRSASCARTSAGNLDHEPAVPESCSLAAYNLYHGTWYDVRLVPGTSRYHEKTT
jgi:hypothetical protein